MDILHTGFLIRTLFVLGLIGAMVIAGAFIARREKPRLSIRGRATGMKPGQRPAIMQRSVRYPTHGERLEANDSDACPITVQRHAP